MPVQPDSRIGLPGLLLLSTGVALTILLIKWFVVARFGLQLDQGEVARVLQALVLAAPVIGAAGALVAIASGRRPDRAAVAVAASIAALLFIDLFFDLGWSRVARYLGAGAFALVVFLVLLRVTQKGSAWLCSAANWWATAAVLAALAVLMTALHAADSVGTWLAIAAAAVAMALLLLWWRTGSALWPLLSVVTVLAAAVVLGAHVPVRQPDNNFAEGKPSVLLVTIDTLRADHVGAYGYANAHTPNFDALAQQGVRFSQTVTANVFTGPSHSSILSGLLSVHHGVLVNHMQLPSAVPTLADILRAEGYVTGAFVSGYTTMDKACGLPSRFQAYDDDIRTFRWLPVVAKNVGVLNILDRLYKKFGSYHGYYGQSYRMGQDTADVAVAWLKENGNRPFFVWTHLFDPHVPYHPPQEYRGEQDGGAEGQWYALDAKARRELVQSPEKIGAMIGLYDAEVAYADAQLGRVVEAARAAAPGGKLLIVVTSDHGESMGEHGLYWFRYLYDPTLLVPLVIVPPDNMPMTPRVVGTQVRLIDLAPTVLDMLDIEAGTTFDGASLLALMRGDSSDAPGARPAFTSRYSRSNEFLRERHAIRDRHWKLIHTGPGWDGGGAAPLEKESRELYNLEMDAGELNNLVGTGMAIQELLEQQLQETIGSGMAPDLELTDEERERLRSLGYVQ